jgi:AcrR family transcriptional regulator
MKKLMKQKVKDLKRELVLEQAGAYFEEVGFEAVTMAELAKKCEMSVGALYKLFDSKDALFYAYVEYQIKALHEEILQASRDEKDTKRRLQIVVEKKFETFCSKSKLIFDPIAGDPLFFTKLSKNRENPAQIIYDYTAELFEKLEESGQIKSGNSMQLSYLFHNFLLGFVEHWLHFGGDLQAQSQKALTLFLEGVKV